MISVRKAEKEDAQLLSYIGAISFIQSHGSSAAEADITAYVNEKYTEEVFIKELSNSQNNYHLIYYNDKPAGYSNITFNTQHPNIKFENIAKLERIYLLEEYYGLKLGDTLFKLNLQLALKKNQSGIWLFVWKENHRAIDFYKKKAFEIIGSHDFKISETHSNPNHQMLFLF